MHRRQFLNAAAVATVTLPLASLPARAQTPPARDDESLVARVAAIRPDTLLEALLTTPVTTPLVPRDTPHVEPVPWEDASDTDLQGAVGGVLFQTGTDARNSPIAMATAIVHADTASATAALADVRPAGMHELYGLPFFAQDFGDYAVAVVQVGNLLLAGGADEPEDTGAVGESSIPGATPAKTGGSGRLHLRALANLAATLDHLEDVLAMQDG